MNPKSSLVDEKKGQLQHAEPGKKDREELEQYESVEKASKELSEGTYSGTAPASHRRV